MAEQRGVITSNKENEYKITSLLEKAKINYKLKTISKDLSLGNMRNIAMSIANGSYACTWDDDDLYADSRISIMIEGIKQTNTNASFLRRIILFYPEKTSRQLAKQEHGKAQ